MKPLCLIALALMAISNVYAEPIRNFGDPNSAKLEHAIQNKYANIVQLGDSHTAADLMTGTMRVTLQQQLDNGGMGWGMPMFVAGQRLSLYGYDNVGWKAISSRTERTENYTLGGLLAVAKQEGATLTIKSKQPQSSQNFIVSVRQSEMDGNFTGVDATGKTFTIEAPIKNNTWQFAYFNATLPFTITAHNTLHSAIGGWWAKNENGQGVIVSALGINGSELSQWDRWNTQAWQGELAEIKPNLVILAYGTNEAYNDRLDVAQAKQNLINTIRQIRQSSPNTAILIVSAPESLKQTSGACGVRPLNLTAVQEIQKQVAESEHTLFWSWQQAMGGSCSMKRWIEQGLGRGDGVHFTALGYERLGQDLAKDILGFAHSSDTSLTSTYVAKPVQYTPEQIKIEWSNSEPKTIHAK